MWLRKQSGGPSQLSASYQMPPSVHAYQKKGWEHPSLRLDAARQLNRSPGKALLRSCMAHPDDSAGTANQAEGGCRIRQTVVIFSRINQNFRLRMPALDPSASKAASPHFECLWLWWRWKVAAPSSWLAVEPLPPELSCFFGIRPRVGIPINGCAGVSMRRIMSRKYPVEKTSSSRPWAEECESMIRIRGKAFRIRGSLISLCHDDVPATSSLCVRYTLLGASGIAMHQDGRVKREKSKVGQVLGRVQYTSGLHTTCRFGTLCGLNATPQAF